MVCGAYAVLLSFALWAGEAPLREALLLGFYGAAFAYRWFARSVAYIDGRIGTAIAWSEIPSATGGPIGGMFNALASRVIL